MAHVQIDEGGRVIQEAILFLDETLDPKVEPGVRSSTYSI